MSKKNYFIIALVFALFGLILAFENIATSASVLILFSTVNQSLFFPFVLLFLIGAACGFFLGLAYKEKSQKQSDLENVDF